MSKKLHLIMIFVAYFITLVLGLVYIETENINILLIFTTSLMISNIFTCLINIRKFIVHFWFQLCIFLFLLSRPLIDYIRTGVLNTYQREAYVFSFVAISLSLMGIMIGGFLYRGKQENKRNFNFENADSGFIKMVQIISGFLFLGTYPFYLLRILERYIYRREVSYYEYYANFKSHLPYFTYVLSSFMIYIMCIYLATNPKKKYARIVLILYVFANSIYLLIGTRNYIILSLIFAYLYYFMRNQNEKAKWIAFKEKLLVVISIPTLMLLMGLLNYFRDGDKVNLGISKLFVDFIYKQGTSFGVLAKGYLYNTNLPMREFRNYTFGSIIDYFVHGNIGINLFGQKAFTTSSNSLELAIQSNSYSHAISYIDLKDRYLEGHGIGSSYIMEVFTDYGFIGLVLVNIFLGFLFAYMVNAVYKKKVLVGTISLFILTNLFFMPRSSFTESFFSIFTIQFWFIVGIIFVAAKILCIKKGNTRVNNV